MEIKQEWSKLLFVLSIGLLLGFLIGNYRVAAFYKSALNTQVFPFNTVISDTRGNITSLANVEKPFACVVFSDSDTAKRFHENVLIPTLQEKPICFRGE